MKAHLRGRSKPLTERLPPAALIRFLRHVKLAKSPTGRVHWLWQRHTDDKGYGQFKFEGTARWAHRLSYATFVGPIPEGMTVHHKQECLQPGCVCPDCLELLTVEENTRERNNRYAASGVQDEPIPE